MAIQAINSAEIKARNRQNRQAAYNAAQNNSSNPSFTGLEQIPVAVADALYNGGFITSFIAQDFFGMAGPRVLEGLNRRPVNKETGKKEGPYNWQFAQREGIREILSGPSAFIIPACILYFVKKYSGKANNVPINMIQGLGNNFIDYAAKNPNTLEDVAKTKTEFYNKVFKNVLNTTLNGQLSEEELTKKAKNYAERAIEIEQAKKKPLWKVVIGKKVNGSAQDLTDSLLDDFMSLKKRYLNPSVNELSVEMTINPEKFGKEVAELTEKDKTGVAFKKLLKTMTDFTDDVIETTGNAMKKCKNKEFDPAKFLRSFVDRRTGSRILTNFGMWSAVVGFYALIPKLYSIGQHGQNPAFALERKAAEEAAKKEQTQTTANGLAKTGQSASVSFGGKEEVFTKTAERVLNSSKLKKFINHFEFDDASMPVSAMMALLYGFCFPTRFFGGPDKYDKRETVTRDLTSFGAILFAATGLSRMFSKVFSKFSGLALNVTPADHAKSFYTKYIRDYFSPISGINVLSNKELSSKYVNITEYKNGIHDFFDFVTDNGGNLKKLLQMDNKVAEYAKTILGKDIKDAVNDKEIKDAFKNITTEAGEKAKAAIEGIFSDSKNTFVKRAKVYNSMFTFLSTIVIVPAFMIWLARTCDRMTRKAREKDKALEAKKLQEQQNSNISAAFRPASLSQPNSRINMQGFLAK